MYRFRARSQQSGRLCPQRKRLWAPALAWSTPAASTEASSIATRGRRSVRWLRGLGRGKPSQAVSLRAKHRLLAFSLNWRSGISNLCAYLCVSVSSEPRYTYLRDEAYEASLTPRSEAMQTSICRHLSSMWVAVAILAGCNSGGSQLAPSDSMQQRGAQFDRVIRGRADFRGNTQSGVVRYTHYLMQLSLAQVRSFDNR